jgi:hypothetical protein
LKDITNETEKEKEIDRLKLLRLESFMLKPPSKQTPPLSDTDKQNNNYLAAKKPDLSDLKESSGDSGRGGSNSESSSTSSSNQLHSSYSECDLVKNIKRDFECGDIIEFVHNGLSVSHLASFCFVFFCLNPK